VHRVAVAGSGTMGAAIAALASARGFPVVLLTRRPEEAAARLRSAQARIAGEGAAGEILVTDDLARLRDVTLVVEAIVEDLAAKHELFARLEEALPAGAFLTSNTSVLGPLLHFFNPVARMELVEIGRHEDTAEETVAELAAFARALGKAPVVIPAIPGGVVSRLVLIMMNEAARLVGRGFQPETVDAEMRLGAHHPMGPLALADLVGLDVVLANLRYLHEEERDLRFLPAEPLVALVAAGHLGRKSGQGFFGYPVQGS
jgi:3-hydroxybutyryl-CoA dehydrogenase